MHKTQTESLEFVQGFKSATKNADEAREIILCTPFTSLPSMSKNLHGSRIKLGAQNIHWEDRGAYTGEISGEMLTEIGIDYVVIGHSERRQYFGETDETVNLRLKAAQKHGRSNGQRTRQFAQRPRGSAHGRHSLRPADRLSLYLRHVAGE